MNDKYLLFLGSDYYPSGGWEDYIDCFDSIEEAIDKIKLQDPYCNWAHVVHKEKIVAKGSSLDKYKETEEGKVIMDSQWVIKYPL